jgi:hypothetical protein
VIYRLFKDNKNISYINKAKFWDHLRYYSDLTPAIKKMLNKKLDSGETIETPLYKFAVREDILKRKEPKARW